MESQPFRYCDPNLPVIPFSNGSEAESWVSQNCDSCTRCIKFDEGDAGYYAFGDEAWKKHGQCRMSAHLDVGFMTGEIPFFIADLIGAEKPRDAAVRTYVDLPSRCRQWTDRPLPAVVDPMQLNLFPTQQ